MSRNSASVRVGDFLGGKNVLRRLKKPSDTSDVPRFKTSTSRLVARKTTWVAQGRRTVPPPRQHTGSRGRRKLRLGQSGVQTILWLQAIGEVGIRANACIVAPVFPTNLLDSVPLASGGRSSSKGMMPRRSSCRTKECREERLVRVRTRREKADQKIRDILNGDQEEKLD